MKIILISPTAVGMASNFSHGSRRSKIFSYGRRPAAFGPTLKEKINCSGKQVLVQN